MKRIVTILLLITLIASLFACGKKEEQLLPSMSLEELSEKIKEEGDFSIMMTLDDDDPFKYVPDNIEINKDMFADFNISSNAIISADTLMLIELKNKDDIPKVKSALEYVRKRIESSFEFYLRDQYEMAKDGKIISKGSYVMLVISKDNDKAIKIFEDSIKK